MTNFAVIYVLSFVFLANILFVFSTLKPHARIDCPNSCMVSHSPHPLPFVHVQIYSKILATNKKVSISTQKWSTSF